jgi:outer membrane receptor protein involved in Fe transport
MALVFGSQAARAEIDPATAEPVAVAAAAEADPGGDPGNGEITITGTRIVRDGYSTPTPVSVISTEEINREAPANISDFVNTLPSVRGSSTPTTTNGALSNGGAGISSVNLRNLGAARTLVLLDGQRSVASDTSGTVDVNTIPQSLIERVEVVTGGASSAYGSDAVSGVINFILNKKFTGIKAEYEYGVTTYGDGSNHKASLTAGTGFGGGRGHAIVSGEYFRQSGIQTVDRDWNDSGFFQIDNPAYSAGACTDNNTATPCVNARLIQGGIGSGNFTPGGLILGARTTATGATAVPLTSATLTAAARTGLTNTYFGTLDPATGLATTGTLAVGPRSGQWMIGGDYKYASSGHVGSATLLPSEDRKSAFGRLSWDFSTAFKVFAQFGYNRYKGKSFYQLTPSQTTAGAPGASTTSGVEILVDNPYLPANIKSLMQANNLAAIVISTGNSELPAQGSNISRQVFRYVGGFDGDFSFLNREWHWGGYYQKGITKSHEQLTNAWNYVRMANATDAVRASDGTIKCRINTDAITTNDDPACVALNRIGVGAVNPAAVAYVLGNGRNPVRDQTIKQDSAALNFSTNSLFELPAGPVSIAFGFEYRKESAKGTVDAFYAPQGAGSTIVPTWRYGNFIPLFGHFDVKEAFLETVVPIIEGMDFNGAVRVTDYSSSGRVETWKTGLTYQVIPDIKLRGTYSRDIRAPNLFELFNPGGGATNSVIRPTAAGATTTVSDTYINSVVGNTALKPEIAKTLGAGIVLTPSFLSGFAASVDYYRIKLSGAISTLSAQNLVDQCFGDKQNATSCSFINLAGGGTAVSTNPNVDIQSVTIKPLNFVGIEDEGIDIEASYRRHIGPGTAQVRALVNRALTYRSNNGVDFARNQVGENSGANTNLPKWTYRISAGYDLDNGLSFQVIGRGISAGTYNNSYIVCTSDCPLNTTDHRTVNTNHIAGAWYFDMNAGYKFEIAHTKADMFLSIRNVFNKDPVLVANGPTGDNTEAYPQTNRSLSDILGRVFRLGLRVAY